MIKCDLCCQIIYNHDIDPEDLIRYNKIANDNFNGCNVKNVCAVCKYYVLYEHYYNKVNDVINVLNN